MQLESNPFYLLGATTRDDRRRILQLADERALLQDEGEVREAVSALTNPRRRVAAEVAWLPGLAPNRVNEFIAQLQKSTFDRDDVDSLPPLARGNLLAEVLLRESSPSDPDELAVLVVELAETFEDLDEDSLVTLLNEDRTVSGFPPLVDTQHLEPEITSRRSFYRKAIRSALDRLPPEALVESITQAIDSATCTGEYEAPVLIHDLVDSFELDAQDFLDKERKNIDGLLSRILKAAKASATDLEVTALVTRLEAVVRNWDRVAQPIQISHRSRGLDHGPSHDLAAKIRGLAIELFNEHSLLDVSRCLTSLQLEVFAELDKVVEKSEEDAATLEDIAEQRSQIMAETAAKAEAWEREITYEADVGILFKDKLRISPDGVEWKGTRIPLQDISAVRWGATRHSVNGVPTGTTYSIFVGNRSRGANLELRNKETYGKFVDRLWKAACARILTEMLEGLREGATYYFGSAVVSDFGVELERRRFFGANERVQCGWTELVIGNGAGTFYIAKRDERKVSVELSYQEVNNAHILEAALTMFWKSASPRLSDLLK